MRTPTASLVVAIVLAPLAAAGAPPVRIPPRVALHHRADEVEKLVRSKPWHYGRVHVPVVEEVLSLEVRPYEVGKGNSWVVYVQGQASFSPPPGGSASFYRHACIYLDDATLEMNQVQMALAPAKGGPDFSECELK